MKIFADRLKELRKEKNISLMNVANAIEVSDTSIMKWENDKSEPTAYNIAKLAKYFGVSTDYLLGIENYDYTIINQNNDLTIEEQRILQNYRKLDPELKKIVEYYTENVLEIMKKTKRSI